MEMIDSCNRRDKDSYDESIDDSPIVKAPTSILAIVMALVIALIVLCSSGGWVMSAKRDEPPCG